MHRMREAFSNLSESERLALARSLSDNVARDWVIQARDAQLPPETLDWCWLFMGGRGTGKSMALSGAIHSAVRAGLRTINLVAPTAADYADTNVEGVSGLLATSDAGERPRWVPSRRRLEWANGAKVIMFSGEEPESLRGAQCELVVIDEVARMRYAQQVFDMAMFGCRLGDKPRILLGTTPRTTPFMKNLIKMKGVSITKGSTFDNAAHLPPDFISKIREVYEGTRLGRQELSGEMILNPENALFKDEWLQRADVTEEMLEQVTVGVDPSGGGDAIGIVAAALLTDGRYAVLADRTVSGSPATWGDAVVRAHDDFDADDVVVEINFGGVMAAEVIRSAADRMHAHGLRPNNLIRVKEVNASRGKVMRAEPISLLYEKGRVLHRRGLDKFEAEMLAFSRDSDPKVDGSPNRLDACVWALTRLCKIVIDIPIA